MEFTYKDRTYRIQLTRAGLRSAEAQGLDMSAAEAHPLTTLYWLFYAALYEEKVSPNQAFQMLDDLLDAPDSPFDFEALSEILGEQYAGLFIKAGKPKGTKKK